jgi:hypothetical protein
MEDLNLQPGWRKSSKSNPSGNCVEILDLPNDGMAVRNSRHGSMGPVLTFTRDEAVAFLEGVKAGEFG